MNIRLITMVLLLIVTGSYLYVKDQRAHETVSSTPSNQLSNNQQTDVGQRVGPTHYLFDLIDHGPEQIKQLLERAESLSRTANASNKNGRIAMVIHGPDIDIFDKKNYEKNKEIIDLAAQLDASDIIDFKVCQVTATARGISESSFPSFMEIVPFAPDEIDRLEDEGYVEL